MILQCLCIQGMISTELPQPGLRQAANLFHARFRSVVRLASCLLQAFNVVQADMPQTVLKAAKLIQWQLLLPQWLCSREAQLRFASPLAQTSIRFASCTFQISLKPDHGLCSQGRGEGVIVSIFMNSKWFVDNSGHWRCDQRAPVGSAR